MHASRGDIHNMRCTACVEHPQKLRNDTDGMGSHCNTRTTQASRRIAQGGSKFTGIYETVLPTCATGRPRCRYRKRSSTIELPRCSQLMWASTSAKRPARTKTTSPRTDDAPAKVARARHRRRKMASRQVGLCRNQQDLQPVEVSVGPPSGG